MVYLLVPENYHDLFTDIVKMLVRGVEYYDILLNIALFEHVKELSMRQAVGEIQIYDRMIENCHDPDEIDELYDLRTCLVRTAELIYVSCLPFSNNMQFVPYMYGKM